MSVIRTATTDDIPQLRILFQEYGAWVASIGGDLCLVSFAAETASLPGRYSRLLIAGEGGLPVGCAALRPLEGNACELKRLYVRPAARGTGLGRRLLEEALTAARGDGYGALRLDTLPQMRDAIRLYRALGFREIPPYGNNPAEAICFERDLGSNTAVVS